MAVLNSFPGVTAEILINGTPVQEYEDVDKVQVSHPDARIAHYQNTHTVLKYITSSTGQAFSIRFRVGSPYTKGKSMDHVKLGFHVDVDGKEAGIVWLSRTWFYKRDAGSIWEESMMGVKEGKGTRCTVREFKFAHIETNSQDMGKNRIKSQANRLREIGCISIRVFSETAGKKGGDIQATSKGFLNSNGLTVPEKSMKGDSKSHGAMLGPPKKTKRGGFFRTKLKDGEDYPLVIFRFMYRGEDALRSLHVVPHSREPTPESEDEEELAEPQQLPELRNEEDFTVSEQAELDAVIAKAKQEAAAKAARERAEEERQRAANAASGSGMGAKHFKRIKRERFEEEKYQARAAKKARSKSGKKGEAVIINLTGSDDET